MTTPEAGATPESVDAALNRLDPNYTPRGATRAKVLELVYSLEDGSLQNMAVDCQTIRAHIAAQQAEVERLRFAATNLLDNLHGLTKLQEVQHRAPTWMKAIENSADRLIAALNPEQKGGE